ncbi:MAG: hypothetical protein ACJATT_002533 [Myxococcota bacterium]|jgi:hypothetical protein
MTIGSPLAPVSSCASRPSTAVCFLNACVTKSIVDECPAKGGAEERFAGGHVRGVELDAVVRVRQGGSSEWCGLAQVALDALVGLGNGDGLLLSELL